MVNTERTEHKGLLKYSIVFVVLVYRNTQDLLDFFSHNNIADSHTIVVNSYYDDESESEFRIIADNNNASFLSVPNKGYGAGNNRGCEFALNNFYFDYLVISNADIIIESLKNEQLDLYRNGMIAPEIINLKGRKQNPSAPFCPNRIYEKMRHFMYNGRHTRLIYIVFIYSRLSKIFYYIFRKFIGRNIFSAHGAFVIIPYNILKQLYPLYDEKMFLFNEEEHLGRLAREKAIKTFYVPEIIIKHKEDGSMKIASVNEFEMMRQSFLIYYDRWIKK